MARASGGEHEAGELSAGLGSAGRAGSSNSVVGASGGERGAGAVNAGLGSVRRAGSGGGRRAQEWGGKCRAWGCRAGWQW